MFTSCVNISQMLMVGAENCHNTLVYSANRAYFTYNTPTMFMHQAT